MVPMLPTRVNKREGKLFAIHSVATLLFGTLHT